MSHAFCIARDPSSTIHRLLSRKVVTSMTCDAIIPPLRKVLVQRIRKLSSMPSRELFVNRVRFVRRVPCWPIFGCNGPNPVHHCNEHNGHLARSGQLQRLSQRLHFNAKSTILRGLSSGKGVDCSWFHCLRRLRRRYSESKHGPGDLHRRPNPPTTPHGCSQCQPDACSQWHGSSQSLVTALAHAPLQTSIA